MRRTFATVTVLAACSLAVAGDQVSMLSQADQAFAAADYKTAVSLYKQLDGKLGDPKQQQTLADHLQFAEKQLAQPQPATQPAAQTVAAAPDPTAMGPNRVKHAAPKPGEVLAMTLHELGNFDYDEDNDKSIPPDVIQLSGAHVKIPGVMFPLDQSGRVSRFLLVNDMMSCCYGSTPKLQHVAYVELPKDKWIAATTDRIEVEGTLKVEVKRDDGFVMSIFQIDPSSIKMAAQ